MYSCRKVTELLSESRERKLSISERMQLWFHLLMCRLCAGHAEDVQRIHDMARQAANQVEHGPLQLSDESKAQIRQKLERLSG